MNCGRAEQILAVFKQRSGHTVLLLEFSQTNTILLIIIFDNNDVKWTICLFVGLQYKGPLDYNLDSIPGGSKNN